MSREPRTTVRPVAVWLLVTAAAGAAGHGACPPRGPPRAPRRAPPRSRDLLVAACATALALALGWLWLVTTTTVAGLLTGRSGPAGATRRLVLVACGVAVVAGTSAPAVAAGGDGPSSSWPGWRSPSGPWPRPTTPGQQPHPRPQAGPTGETYVVRPGDSLSSIALAHPGAGSLDERWRAIWRANREVVGDDPDLIHPGQALRLPGHPPHPAGRRPTMSHHERSEARVIPLRAPTPLASVQGSLALDLTPRTAPPRPRLRSTRTFDLVAVAAAERGHVDAFVGRYLQAVVEIAAGDRPLAQVLRHTVPEVYDDLAGRARAVAAVSGAAPAGRGPNPARPVVIGVRTALIRSDAVEASAHVRYGRRSRAVAARFEVVRDRWQCVAISWG